MADEPHAFSKAAEELIREFRRAPADDPPRAKSRPTKELAPLIEQLLQKHRIGRDAPEHTIREQWTSIVGPANAAYSHPAIIERNRLIVLARHAVVSNELFHHRTEIVGRIQKLPGCSHVKAIHLRLC